VYVGFVVAAATATTRGRGYGAGRGKDLQRKCGACPLPKKRKGL